MDTKSTKYKYSKFNKIICSLLIVVFSFLASFNIFESVYYYNNVSYSAIKSGQIDLMDYKPFYYSFNYSAQNLVKSLQMKNLHISVPTEQIKDAVNEYRYEFNNVPFVNADEFQDYGESGDYYYNNGFYYDSEFEYRIYIEEFNEPVLLHCKYGTDVNTLEKLFTEQFNSEVEKIKNNVNESNSNINLNGLNYYLQSSDNTVLTNVYNKDEFINSIKNNENYIVINNGDIVDLSESFKTDDKKIKINISSDEYEEIDDYVAYISYTQTEDDFMYRDYLITKDIDGKNAVVGAVISTLIALLFIIALIRLAGHKNNKFSSNANEITLAKIDKIPLDFHFVLSIVAVTGAFCVSTLAYVGRHLVNYELLAYAIFTTISVLIVLEFITSFARLYKSKTDILRNLVTYKIFAFISKKLKLAKDECKKVAQYMPKELNKKILVYLSCFVGVNIAVAVISSFFSSFTASIPIILITLLIAFDIFFVFKAVDYFKYIDLIVSNEKLDDSVVSSMPYSLKNIYEDSLNKQDAFDKAVLKAVKEEKTKTELITNVSHDLKTPLTSIITYIDLLQKCDIEDENAIKFMKIIDEKSNKLKLLIEELVEASKISSKNVVLHKSKLNLHELVAQAIVEDMDAFEEANLKLVFEEKEDEECFIYADGKKIYRVFENLLSNAKKYSMPNTRVYAKLYTKDDKVLFEIKNISKFELNISADELFERFTRGDKSRSEEGNGLGLSIAKDICSLNDGNLLVDIDGDLFKATIIFDKIKDDDLKIISE